MAKNNYIVKEEEVAPGVFRKITALEHIMMVLLRFENGPMSEADPFHSHPHEQITYVKKGKLRFLIEDESYELEAGDSITIASGRKHSIQTRCAGVELIDCFSPIREDFLQDES